MTLKELKEWVDYILENPDTENMQVVVEPHSEWQHYHLSPGFALRHQHGKESVIVWRMEP